MPNDDFNRLPRLKAWAGVGKVSVYLGTSSASPNLTIDGEDNPEAEEHAPFDGELFDPTAERSGVAEMQVSNRADFEDVDWEPYNPKKAWTFAPDANGRATVYVRFRDAAGNVSDVASLVVLVDETSQPGVKVFLPFVTR